VGKAEVSQFRVRTKSIVRHYPSNDTYEDVCRLLNGNRLSEAIRRIAVLKRQGDKPDAYLLNLEGIYFHRKDHVEKALSLYRRAVRMNPGLWTAYYHIGIAYLDLRAYKKALPWLLRAWPLYVKAHESCERKAWVLQALGECYFRLLKFRLAAGVLGKRRNYISNGREILWNDRNLSNCRLAEAMRLSEMGNRALARRRRGAVTQRSMPKV